MRKALIAVALLSSANANAMECYKVNGWTPIPGQNNESADLSPTSCQSNGFNHEWLAVVDLYNIMTDDIWLEVSLNDAHVTGHQFYSTPNYAGTSAGIPVIELEIILGGGNWYPLVSDPPDPCAPNATWWDGTFKYGTFGGYNCHVDYVPAGENGFVWSNNYYIQPDESTRICTVGTWDSANCGIGLMPTGSTAFTTGESLFITEQSGGGCGLGFPFQNACYIGEIGLFANTFIYNGLLYATSIPTCNYGEYDGANCYMGTPDAGTTAFMWPDSTGSFYYAP